MQNTLTPSEWLRKQAGVVLSPTRETELLIEYELGTKAKRALKAQTYPAKTQQHLMELWERARAAKDLLVRHNLRLVWSSVKDCGVSMPTMDLLQEGAEGLCMALEKWDFSRTGQQKFSTYAIWWIRHKLLQTLKTDAAIRIPPHLSSDLRKLYRVQEELLEKGLSSSAQTIALTMGLSLAHVKKLLEYSKLQYVRELDAPLGKGDDAATLCDYIPAPTSPEALDKDVVRVLHSMLNELDPRLANILRMRYGINIDKSLRLREVGARHGITRERARQLENDGLDKLRHPATLRKLQELMTA